MTWHGVADAVLVRSWDGQSVVYDRRSGDTHCLDRTASTVLSLLTEGRALGVPVIRERIAQTEGEPPADDGVLTDALAALERLGLVRRAAD